ncbi:MULTISPECIES: fimbrial protein [Providencia]|uniref:Fimbrial protein n=1 Tax=Providencia rettgeri TaxID=587 RepID=A0AB35LC03_PRORE|nr:MULTISPECIES: fimbrial protein [Providencia]EHZ7765129.1 fimbrial protein [Providencia rettgeri]EIJ7168271.1 fimbrial protein [Providencia rettgeri]EJD6049015.1 fimbrial protein [Providencia rettgeri]EJD6475435.1 fimbrial protein [Providencia rettgeri]ELH9583951.1 fimbrial protein [Providencia rettgeri]
MIMWNNNQIKHWMAGFIMVMSISSAQANWAFDGTLIIPPVCQLSHDDPIKVSFGKVGVRKINGTAFKQSIPFQLDCVGDMTQPWDISLIFGGTPAGSGFDNATLRTVTPLNNGKLGIQIQKNGQPQPLNEPFLINAASLPSLSAVPVMRSGSELVGDNFTASGTLTIIFE